MTAYLLDVNMLLALSWPGHKSHGMAQKWFGRNASKGWATCPMVEAGFVRILSNPAFSAHAVSPTEAIEALGISTGHPSHQFWPDDIPLARGLANWQNQIRGHQQITDAYLIALSIHHHGKLATLDKRLMALVDGGSVERAHLELIE
jgi:uncharacterized protein